jgi:3',5'-cyclic-AMP phosphodiesterase
MDDTLISCHVELTLGTARPDKDEGEVGYRQNLWMENTLRKNGNDDGTLTMFHSNFDLK